MNTAIGIDLGATNIKGVIIDEHGQQLHRINQPTQDQRDNEESDGSNWKQAVKQVVQTLKARQPNVKGIGLAAPGVANKGNTAIANMPGRMFGLEHFHWADFLEEPRVPVLNDAHAALIAESAFGAGKGCQHLALLTLGTGVGGGLLVNGELYQGFLQRAGHLGHISLNADATELTITQSPAALELAIGDISVEKRSMGRFTSNRAVVEAYEQGDPYAAYVWLTSVQKLCVGICSIINAFSPEAVIIGGGVVKAGDALFKPLASFMEVYEWRPEGQATPIYQAAFADYAGAIGAACYALNKQP